MSQVETVKRGKRNGDRTEIETDTMPQILGERNDSLFLK